MSFLAIGGTKTVDGDYTVHTFTADGELECGGTAIAEVFRVGGGAGGSSGGGGAGGYMLTLETLTGTMPVTIGAGGAGGNVSSADGASGGNTVFAGKTSPGGGGGGRNGYKGNNGASGGGAAWSEGYTLAAGAATGVQGHAGGVVASMGTGRGSGGGGGGGAVGSTGNISLGGAGGLGIDSDIVQRGVPVGYAGGGGGGVNGSGTAGAGTHGGGAGTSVGTTRGANGAANKGGGGGGCRSAVAGGDGGSGCLVVRYLTASVDTDLTPVLSAISALRLTTNIVCEGDSHTAPGGGIDYPAQMAKLLGPTYSLANVATGGQYLYLYGLPDGEGTMLAQAAIQVDPLYRSEIPSICIIWGGANDLVMGGATAQDVYDHVVEYAADRKAIGWKVIALTYLPHTNPENWAKRNAVNALLRADHDFLDGFADIAADVRIGDDGAAGVLPYFVTGDVHMAAAGKAIVAGIVVESVLGLLNPLTATAAASAASADAKLGTPAVSIAADISAVQDAADAVELKTNTIGALAVTVTSPVAASGTITVYNGDDYASADSRAITVTVADATHAMGLDDVDAVVKLKATQATWDAASTVSTTDGYTVTFEATAAQTAAVTRAQHYELEATLANGHVVTLAKGSLVTVKDIPVVAAPEPS